MCSKEGRRIILWMCWVVNMLVTSLYYALSFATSSNLVRSYRQLDIPISNEIWRAPIAAAVLGGLLTLFFNLISCAVLAKKSVDRRGGGFGLGFVAAMCASLAFFSLLCGLVLDGFKDVVRSELQVKLQDTWTQLNSGVYVATIALAYLCFVMFLLFFVALIVFQSAVTEELGIAGAGAGAGDGGGGGGGLLPFSAGGSAGFGGGADPALRNPFAAHMARKYETFSPPSSGYDSPQGPRIPAVRPGGGGDGMGGGGGGGAMAQTASPLAPPSVMMAMPTPLPGQRVAGQGPFAHLQQDSAL